jgi:hypothetical protein
MATIFMPVHDIPLSAPPEPFQESQRGTETLNCELDEWNAGYRDEEAVAFRPTSDSDARRMSRPRRFSVTAAPV